MTSTARYDATELRAALTGQLIEPSDGGYEVARKVFNADIDRRPALIAQCASSGDVAAAVSFARTNGLEIAVRSGAHSMSGASTVDDGLVIDLSAMRDVKVDPAKRIARVQGGALNSDLDAAAQEHGLAVTAGMVGHTGLGGLTLGGGMGWLSRKAGLTIDNLLSAEIVVADGRTLRVSETEHPDLFWAIRGGGGNFGVVTEFEFRLHEAGPMIRFGLLLWPYDRGAEALRVLREVVADLPPDVNAMIAGVDAPPAPFIPEEHHLRRCVGVLLVGFGSEEEFTAVADRIRSGSQPLIDATMPMPYTVLQTLFDESNCWGHHYYEKSCLLEEFTDEAIEVILEHLPRRQSPLSVLLTYRLDAAYCEQDEDATAFGGGRSPRYALFLIGNAPDPALLPAERAWARDFWEALRPMSMGAGTYVNGMYEYEEDRVLASYGAAKYARLAAIKGQYDPGNLFHRNINIKPA
ncbi:FAD-binding oxidoreductase [Pseudonocardia yuanmonensis]|uniref:FAD-binding oxidoreductase n=1 Tax=Pseudonocardia yuanmonensis TaxID=1095914 RepID=A0ABP8WTD8_9PSEU